MNDLTRRIERGLVDWLKYCLGALLFAAVVGGLGIWATTTTGGRVVTLVLFGSFLAFCMVWACCRVNGRFGEGE